MLLALLQAVRPRQWVKNLFVGAPVLFAKALTDGRAATRAAAAVAIFCLIASAVYLWNDLVDVEKDRAHPRKKNRPIASGALSMDAAKGFAAAFATVGLALGFALDWRFAAVCALYLAQSFAYSLVLKRIPYVDVMVIASGFLLRVYAGALAVGVHASPWLLLCTGLLACFLGFGKRAHELSTAGARGVEQRAVLTAYHPTLLRIALYATGAATTLAYLAYTLDEHTRTFFHTTRMVWTVPAIAIGVTRYLMLVAGRPKAESPTEEMLRDPLFLANLAVWVAAVLAIIYLAHG
ncbi:MAG: decaprenyl-phosphate phosphoribosyltransferase [Myxococcales bacterium]|nr:decaprenyl-phosphate phosphoribosyltransferase [Myxococcales bacterium]